MLRINGYGHKTAVCRKDCCEDSSSKTASKGQGIEINDLGKLSKLAEKERVCMSCLL